MQNLLNDIVIIFYLEKGKFDPTLVGKLGTVPQVFAVVRPEPNQHFSVGFFSNINIKETLPRIPVHQLSPLDTKQLILTKLHNGLIMTRQCPPLNRLFFVPRGEKLKEILAKYPEPIIGGTLDTTMNEGKGFRSIYSST